MAKDITDLLPKVMIYAKGCSEPVAVRFLRDAAIALCRRTHIWRDDDAFTVATPDCEGICTIQDANLIRISSARFEDSYNLEPVTVPWLDEEFPGWQDRVDESVPRYITQLSPNTITIYPRATGAISLKLILEPSQTAETLPDFIVDRYASELGLGAAAEIMLIPGEPFTNPNLGAANAQRFQAALDKLSIQVRKGQQGARHRSRSAYF